MHTAREATARLADLLRREHHALAEFLIALAAFDRERRWVDLGYRSLFDFLTRELGLPKGPAYYRMAAAGLVRKYPELVEPLRDGRLHLTSIVELAKVITPGNLAEVLPRFFHASKREAQEVRAALLPAEVPPMRTVVTSVAARDPVHDAAVAPQETFTGGAVLPEEPRACQLSVPDVARPEVKAVASYAEVEPLTADLRRLHVTVSRRLLDKLAAARDALSHSHPCASEETILELGLDLIIARHRKRRGIGARPRRRGASTTSTSTSTTTSTTTSQVAAARRMYGDATMDRFTRPKGSTCSEPVAPYLAVSTDVEAGGQAVAPPEDAVLEEPAPAAAPGAGPSRQARRGSSGCYFENATFSRRSFSSRVPMDRRMQPSRPL